MRIANDLGCNINRLIKPDFTQWLLIGINIFDTVVSSQMPVPNRFGGKVANRLHRICPSGMLICQNSALIVEGYIIIINVEIISWHP